MLVIQQPMSFPCRATISQGVVPVVAVVLVIHCVISVADCRTLVGCTSSIAQMDLPTAEPPGVVRDPHVQFEASVIYLMPCILSVPY